MLALLSESGLQPKVLVTVETRINANSDWDDALPIEANIADLTQSYRVSFALSMANGALSFWRRYFERIINSQFHAAS